MSKHLALAAITAIAFVISACGGSEPAPTSSAESPAPTEVSASSATATPAASDDPAVEINEDSPIEALLGVPVFDDDAMNEWFGELDIERQRMTAECMIREGFEFVPETAPHASGPAAEYATSSREYAAAYGFGIGFAFNAAEYDPTANYATANSTYLASLSEGETAGYYVALRGPELDETNEDGIPAGGCEGEAFTEVFSVLGVMVELTPVVDGYYEQFLADSRMIALNGTWQRCMSDAGFTHATPDEMSDTMYDTFDGIISNPVVYEPVDVPDELPDPGFTFAGDVYSYHPKLTADGQGQVDAFIADEIATAVAHWDCRQPLVDEELAIQREYEAKFVTEAAPLVADQMGDN